MHYADQKLSTSEVFCGILNAFSRTTFEEVCMNLQSDLSELSAKHKVLEAELAEILAHPASTDQEIAEIKRQKLLLKDEIAKLERSTLRAA
jgi:hypothetical protein